MNIFENYTVFTSAEDWHTAQTKPDSEYHVLPSVGMQLAFFNTVKHDYTRLPQWVDQSLRNNNNV